MLPPFCYKAFIYNSSTCHVEEFMYNRNMVGDIAHICNRGVEKRKIFLDTKDYKRFIENLYFLNNKKGKLITEKKNIFQIPHLLPKQDKLVEILKWTIMPNHYHLLLYEVVDGGILEFTKRVGNAYTKYFNIKTEGRSGYLFQNSAKILRIKESRHYLYIPFYIDLNILDLEISKNRDVLDLLMSYEWSSFRDYYNESKYLPIINREIFYKNFDFNKESYKKQLLDLPGRGVEDMIKI
ncbi:MAG: hypothetical protein AAB695_01620 [Patescibacteria group bacterium]